jgi:DNA-binding NtrC family response regulator
MKGKVTNTSDRQKRILVVDDSELMRVFLSDSLSLIGYEVVTVGDGFDGFELFSQNRFDLVITDCYVPGIDGCYLSGLIKKRSPHTPVIMITGQPHDEISEKMAPNQVDWQIFKPFEWEELLHIVQSFLVNPSSELISSEPYDLIKS